MAGNNLGFFRGISARILANPLRFARAVAGSQNSAFERKGKVADGACEIWSVILKRTPTCLGQRLHFPRRNAIVALGLWSTKRLAGAVMTMIDSGGQEVRHLRDLSGEQWRSGIAAWMGWLFDGLDMHLYVLVAAPFVVELLGATSEHDPDVGFYSSWIQAAFLIGWALGGGFFGRIGDRLGRSRALMLTISTYAMFTGLSFFAQTWWQLLIFRFLAALGIGGEWAVGASLLSETWPRRWRPWMAAVLQTAVNVGVMLAGLVVFLLAGHPNRGMCFSSASLPALLVVWIRKAVPESEQWQSGQQRTGRAEPRFADLFRGPSLRRTTVLTLLVCALSLTAHWAFLFWYLQHLRNLPDLADLDRRRKEPIGEPSGLAGDWHVDLREFLCRLAGSLAEISPGDRAVVSGLWHVDGGDVRRAAVARRFVDRLHGHRHLPGRVRVCSRCTCRRCFRRCCGRPARASATTSAASPRGWAPWHSGCRRRTATIAMPCSTPAACSSLRPLSPGCCRMCRMSSPADVGVQPLGARQQAKAEWHSD